MADFLALTAYAVYQYGYIGFFELMTANVATIAAFVDLVIALSLIIAWMVRDARARGVSPVPYAVDAGARQRRSARLLPDSSPCQRAPARTATTLVVSAGHHA